MFRFISTKLQQIKPRSSPRSSGCMFTTSSRKNDVENSTRIDEQSLKLSYLQNSHGWPVGPAILAPPTSYVDTIQDPESLTNLLRTHGMSQSHINRIILMRPSLLVTDFEKTIRPNLELFRTLGVCGSSLIEIVNKYPRVLEANASAAVEFFRENGFSDKEIANLTIKFPRVYTNSIHKTIKPKIDFLKSEGFLESDIAKVLSSNRYTLKASLDKQIKPCVQFLRRFLGDDESVLSTLMKCYRTCQFKLEEHSVPNMSILASHGVPQSLILKVLMYDPSMFLVETSRFNEVVTEVMKLDMNPSSSTFVMAIRSMALISKARWEQNLEVYASFGLSKDEVYSAFKMFPICMSISERKIRKMMSFFENKLHMKPSVISKNPMIMLFSLENRILPRCSVLQLLSSKQLLKQDISLVRVFRMSEKNFVEKLVNKYQDLVPEVVDVHQGKIEFKEFPDLVLRN